MKQVQELQDPELIHRRLKSTLKALLIVVCAGIAYVAVFRMTETGVPCLFRTMTGSLCPFCGMTHALGELSKGHFASAMSYNALSLTLFPVFMRICSVPAEPQQGIRLPCHRPERTSP